MEEEKIREYVQHYRETSLLLIEKKKKEDTKVFAVYYFKNVELLNENGRNVVSNELINVCSAMIRKKKKKERYKIFP